MGIAYSIGKKTTRIISSAFNTALLIIILLLLSLAFYAIWDTGQVHHAAEAARYEKFKPTVENAGVTFDELKAINPEVLGWLTVYGTHIDYPVVQSKDSNLKYVNTDAFGNYSLSGAIFLDFKNSPDFSDFNSIIYGHHMEKQTMFGEIGFFTDKSYFDARKYGVLFYEGKEHGIEFFTFAHTDAYNNAVFRTNVIEEDDRQQYLELLYALSLNTHEDVQVTIEDRIVMLSTCSETTTNGRDILVGRLCDEVFHDPFYVKPAIPAYRTITSIDKLPDLWAQTPLWMKLVILAAPFLLLLLVIMTVRTVRKRKRPYSRLL